MGLFITFEGVEGSGKSTQAGLLRRYLESKGRSVVSVREPGGTPLGDGVRAILLDSRSAGIDPWAELFLYEACRAELVMKVIRPALLAGSTVICDRYTDSTVAYQGYGRGLDMGPVRSLNAWATGGLAPDVTVLMDCPPEEGLKRAFSRPAPAGAGNNEDRFEREALAFHERVRRGYLAIAGEEPRRVVTVDGAREILSIHGEICDIIERIGAVGKA
jgi:dTMP kinase